MAEGAQKRRILVAVDGGEESMYALSWCINNVDSDGVGSGDALLLLYGRPPCLTHPFLDESDIVAGMEKYGLDAANAAMEKARLVCKDLQNVKVETKVECGDPWKGIREAVASLEVDLLIMGSHGYGPFKRAFLGSVSSHCAQSVECPVRIVKKPKQ